MAAVCVSCPSLISIKRELSLPALRLCCGQNAAGISSICFLESSPSSRLCPSSHHSCISQRRKSGTIRTVSSSTSAFPLRSSRGVSRLFSPSFTSISSSRVLNPLTPTMWRKGKVSASRAGNIGEFRSKLVTDKEGDTVTEAGPSSLTEEVGNGGKNGNGGSGDGGGGNSPISWASSGLMFALWAGFLVYTFTLAPNQTPDRDFYFLQKLSGLNGGDGYVMNKVLSAQWAIMGMWALIYSSLLLPTGRSKGVKVGPFATASIFVGAFALLPYFGLWRPPPPRVPRRQLRQFPLIMLESKITAVVAIVGGVLLAVRAGLAGAEAWGEFAQYIQESRFIHVMTIDFMTLSTLAPFWVYNDQCIRQGSDKVSWLVPLSTIPYFGPALYLLFRRPLPSTFITSESEDTGEPKESE